LLKVSGFLSVLLRGWRELVKLFVVDVGLEPALHDILTDFFNAIDKETFKIVLLSGFIDPIGLDLLRLETFTIKASSQVFYCVHVVGLKSLNILDYLYLDIFLGHLGFHYQLEELSEFGILGGHETVPTYRASTPMSLSRSPGCLAFSCLPHRVL
jgi:hypothetical protein